MSGPTGQAGQTGTIKNPVAQGFSPAYRSAGKALRYIA
jgi:hypothetical protein